MGLASFIQRCGRACGLRGSLFHTTMPEDRLVVVRELIQSWDDIAKRSAPWPDLAEEATGILAGYRLEEAQLLREMAT